MSPLNDAAMAQVTLADDDEGLTEPTFGWLSSDCGWLRSIAG